MFSDLCHLGLLRLLEEGMTCPCDTREGLENVQGPSLGGLKKKYRMTRAEWSSLISRAVDDVGSEPEVFQSSA